MAELEDPGYRGFVFAYIDDDVTLQAHQPAAEYATPKLLDYLH